jgi:hypothetical protein
VRMIMGMGMVISHRCSPFLLLDAMAGLAGSRDPLRASAHPPDALVC